MNSPILITGAARSGTSLIAGIINLCGAFSGNCVGPNKYNAKGMFENQCIRQNILKPYLKSQGYDALGQYPIPDTKKLQIPCDFKDRVLASIKSEGLVENMPWFYKGAKMCQMWPVWDYAFPDAKWVIVRRKTSDIVHSCMHTGFMRAFSDKQIQKAIKVNSAEEGWLWWVRRHEDYFVEMIKAGLNCKIIWPERMVCGDYKQIHELIDWLGLEWHCEIYNFIEPKLWRGRK
jgi:hypothetical protein